MFLRIITDSVGIKCAVSGKQERSNSSPGGGIKSWLSYG
jgi:hypothetical protein